MGKFCHICGTKIEEISTRRLGSQALHTELFLLKTYLYNQQYFHHTLCDTLPEDHNTLGSHYSTSSRFHVGWHNHLRTVKTKVSKKVILSWRYCSLSGFKTLFGFTKLLQKALGITLWIFSRTDIAPKKNQALMKLVQIGFKLFNQCRFCL